MAPKANTKAKKPVTLIALPKGGTVASRPPGTPRYIRLPADDELCAWSSLSRAKINHLILPHCPICQLMKGVTVGEKCPKCKEAIIPEPPVKSIVIPNTYKNKKGCRLIVLESLMGYLRSLEKRTPQAA